MTVADLIKHLRAIPQDLPVYRNTDPDTIPFPLDAKGISVEEPNNIGGAGLPRRVEF